MRKSSSLTSRPRGARCRGCPPAPAARPLRFSRNTRHETRITAFMLLLTRPFLDIPGFLPRENGSLPRENGFLPPDDDFLPNLNESKTRYFPQFFGMRRNSSDNPQTAVRAPSVVLARPHIESQNSGRTGENAEQRRTEAARDTPGSANNRGEPRIAYGGVE